MAKQFGGAFANYYGKVGNVVARIRQGRTILSIYQPNVLNPRTSEQVKVRNKFAAITRYASGLAGALKYGFHNLDGYKTGNYFSAAVGYNSKNDAYDETIAEIDANKFIIAQGNVDLPYSPSASAEGNTVTITWSDNSGMGNALATDKICVVAYNPSTNQSVISIDAADRSERNASLALPTAWSGATVDVWLFVKRPSTNDCSMSTHLAALPL